MEETTQVMNGPPPVGPAPTFNEPLPPPRNDNGKTRVIIVGIVALVVALVSAATVVVITSNSARQAKGGNTATYQRQLDAAFQPLIESNQRLSVAMDAADGSRSANNAIKVSLTNAQATVTATQGAVGAIVVPVKDTALGQQTSQALTQENGYLQVVSATFVDPSSASAAQVQPSAANLVSALIPLDTVVPNGQKSVFGVTNFYNWSQGAAAMIKKNKQANVVVPPGTTTPVPQTQAVVPPTTTPSPGLPLHSVDQNISATPDISDSLAENVFYDYWNNGGSGSESYSSWSGKTFQYYDVSASSDGSMVTALVSGTGQDGAYVTFPQSAVDNYTQAQADAFVNSGVDGP
jgi:hypothetical protein